MPSNFTAWGWWEDKEQARRAHSLLCVAPGAFLVFSFPRKPRVSSSSVFLIVLIA